MSFLGRCPNSGTAERPITFARRRNTFQKREARLTHLLGSRVCILLASPCKTLQAVPEQASSTGFERPRRVTADPSFPGSAAIGFDFDQLEGLALARAWGFESLLSHQS